MTNQPNPTLAAAAASYLAALDGRNRSPQTLLAYRTDLRQFLAWLAETNVAIRHPADVARRDIFAYCAAEGWAEPSPAAHVETPKKEKHGRAWFRPDEYPRILGWQPRGVARNDIPRSQVAC